MARFNMVRSSSLSLCSVMLAMMMASLSLSPVVSGAANSTAVLNGLTDKVKMTHPVFVRCTFVYEGYRYVESNGILLKPGEEKTINVDEHPGVKQVECDITRYSNSSDNMKYNMKAIVWFFTGPSQTIFRFDDTTLLFATSPDLGSFSGVTSMQWTFDQEYYYVPKFLVPNTTSIHSRNEASLGSKLGEESSPLRIGGKIQQSSVPLRSV